MKNLSKKLLMSVVAVTLVVIALGTSTFAWFTLSNKAEVGQFEAQVTAGEGIEISLDNSTWYTTLTTTIMEEFLYKTVTDFKLNAVTSTNNVDFTKINTTNDATVPAISLAGATSTDKVDYIEFKLYFKSVNASKIKVTEVDFGGSPKTFTVDVPTLKLDGTPANDKVAGDEMTVYAKDAARVSFAGTVDGSAKNVVYQTGLSTSNTVSTVDPTIYGQYDYFFSKNKENIFGHKTNLMLAAEEASASGVNNVLTEVVTDITGGVGQIVVRVWIEGWDQEAYNAILSANLSIGIKFEGIE